MDAMAAAFFCSQRMGRQAVRASSSIADVFETVRISKQHYVYGGLVSPVPVDAARELGEDIVIAVEISDKPRGQALSNLIGIMGQSITIMGHRLGQAELEHASKPACSSAANGKKWQAWQGWTAAVVSLKIYPPSKNK